MTRGVRIVMLCAVLGPVTTVGVAWWHAAVVDPNWSTWKRGRSHLEPPLWEYYSWERTGAARTLATPLFDLPELGLNVKPPATEPPLNYPWSRIHNRPDFGEVKLREDARGWPLLALRSWWHGRHSEIGTLAELDDVQWGIEITASTGDRRALPLRPIWSGFAADSLVFFIAWNCLIFLPIAAVRGLRRFRNRSRRRSGHCRTCGYDLRHADHEACPECGAQPPNPPTHC